MKRLTILATLLLFYCGQIYATTPIIIQTEIEWTTPFEKNGEQVLTFNEATYSTEYHTLPIFSQQFALSEYGTLSVEFSDVVYAPLEKAAHPDDQFLAASLEATTSVNISRRKPIGLFSFIPIRKTLTGYEKVVSFKATISLRSEPMPVAASQRTGFNSVLASGEIYKLAVSETGVYKLSYDFLKNQIGIDVDNIDPRHIQIYGNGGGMLPEANSVARPADLEENAIVVVGENDGAFGVNDYVLFYGESPNKWNYDENAQLFNNEMHLYTEKNHYFLKIANSNGKRIGNQASVSGATYSTSTYNTYQHYEKEAINLLDQYVYASASGKLWVGEAFKYTTSRDFPFTIPNLVTSEPVYIKTQVAARSVTVSNSFDISVNNAPLYSIASAGVTNNVEATYARIASSIQPYNATSGNLTVNLQYNKPYSEAEGWLDYITINARSQLNLTKSQLTFRDVKTIGQAASTFNLTATNPSNLTIWDITDPMNIAKQAFNVNGSTASFAANTSDLKEFIAFDGTGFLTPEVVDTVANQNLHGGFSNPELVVVYHKKFASEAQRFATHRSSFSNMSVALAEITEVYNEFSSGNPDVSGLRDFSKYLYETYPSYKYMLLFGDASFDYKYIDKSNSNTNYVPVFETALSTHPIGAYNTDDYFALLDPNEGGYINSGGLDIGIGRLPVRTLEEAEQVVDKIIRYDTNSDVLGDWKNRMTFVADDEDSNLHMRDADEIAVNTQNNNRVMNLDKIYLDAYPQISTHAGDRIPTVTEALHSMMYKGNFTVNYMGHGGEEGWAQERVLQIPHIQSWQNNNKLPLFVTATCSFAPFDDPGINSAGEIILLKPDGGAIALFTTVRAVYTSSNKKLTSAVFDNLYTPINGKMPTLGELLSLSKNVSGAGIENSRKFALLGDPSQTLAYPKYKVITTKINGVPATTSDTIRAFEEVTIEGFIAGTDSLQLNSFNGIIYPTIFDKPVIYKTLGQDQGSTPQNYALQKAVLFKGRASVQNGAFKFTFIVPKDINYAFGEGKISYYADDGVSLDAHGYHNGLVIGGTNPNAIDDDTPPTVQVFMNNDEFVFGGITDDSPVLYAKLEDDNGINTTGTGVGHDLTGVLNEDTKNTYVLNDFYESELNSFKKGEVRYSLSNLEEGRHQVKVKAWDIANNSGEGYTEFVVASNASVALNHVLNYPNPFTTHTEFQFEHNLPNQPLTVQVQIFSVSGSLIKTISEEVQSDGYRVTGIGWDGTDDFGNRIGRGVYMYKVSIGTTTSDGSMTSASQFEKLVILK